MSENFVRFRNSYSMFQRPPYMQIQVLFSHGGQDYATVAALWPRGSRWRIRSPATFIVSSLHRYLPESSVYTACTPARHCAYMRSRVSPSGRNVKFTERAQWDSYFKPRKHHGSSEINNWRTSHEIFPKESSRHSISRDCCPYIVCFAIIVHVRMK